MVTCTHRSHLDYILLASEFEKAGVNRIRFAAGDNLTKLPVLGKIFREMGAFSVHRGKASQRSYLFKLTEQVKKIILNDDVVIVFPEGGRSYNGHMLELKGGILGSAIVAQQEDPSREMNFVPVGISYEVPVEVPFFPLALKGKKLRDEGSNKLVKAWGEFLYYFADAFAFIKRGFLGDLGIKYGKIVINVGDPIPLNTLTDIEKNYRANSKNSFLANRTSIKEATLKLQKIFIDLFELWEYHLLSYLIKQNGYSPVDKDSLKKLYQELKKRGAHFVFDSENIDIDELVDNIYQRGVEQLVLNKAISKKSNFKVKNRFIIDYFSASVEDWFSDGGNE